MSWRATSGAVVLVGVFVLAACGPSRARASRPVASSPATVIPSPTAGGEVAVPTLESPLPPETNPVGDIPDNQAFVNYAASPGGYSLDAPEGWARTVDGSGVRFVDKFDGISVSVAPAQNAPTAASAQQSEVPALVNVGHAVQVGEVIDVNLPSGPAVRITATANSDPDPVTNKQVRLEEEFYLLYHNGTLATLKLWAPQGADNVDQWQRIVQSFAWK